MDPKNTIFNFTMEATQRSRKASANIIQMFEELEPNLVIFFSSGFSNIYTISPLQLLLNQIFEKDNLDSIGLILWKEDAMCLKWLNTKEPNSVVYVNFSSLVVMSSE